MRHKKRSRMGRPPLPEGTAKQVVLSIRVAALELQALKAEAKQRGISMGNLLLEPWRRGTRK